MLQSYLRCIMPVILMQALFRKIAAALPGMESVAQNKTEQLEEVKLTPSSVSLDAKAPAQPSSCAC